MFSQRNLVQKFHLICPKKNNYCVWNYFKVENFFYNWQGWAQQENGIGKNKLGSAIIRATQNLVFFLCFHVVWCVFFFFTQVDWYFNLWLPLRLLLCWWNVARLKHFGKCFLCVAVFSHSLIAALCSHQTGRKEHAWYLLAIAEACSRSWRETPSQDHAQSVFYM